MTFKEHVLDCYPQEACGILVEGVFTALENCHSDPVNFFSLSQKDSFLVASCDKDVILLHSHTTETFTEDPRTPSLEDMMGQKMSSCEWGIVHCDGENVSEVLYFGSPSKQQLLQRDYIHNVTDCFTLARDFYYQEYGEDLGSHPRPSDWQTWNCGYIEQTYSSLGFSVVPLGVKRERGDVVLLALGSVQANHIGVVTGEDSFIHHLHKRKSCTDRLSKWDRQIVKTLRKSNGTNTA